MSYPETDEIEDSLIVVGAHLDLTIQRDTAELEDEIMRLLRENKKMSVSSIWKRTHCHLWEIDAALRRLKRKGMAVEMEM